MTLRVGLVLVAIIIVVLWPMEGSGQAIAHAHNSDPTCEGEFHGTVALPIDEATNILTVTMIGDATVSVSPGTYGTICIPWSVGDQKSTYREVRKVVVVSASADAVRIRVVQSDNTMMEGIASTRVTFSEVIHTGYVDLGVTEGRASVLYNGVRIGNTPMVLYLPPGDYPFELSRMGYETKGVLVTVAGRDINLYNSEELVPTNAPSEFPSRSARAPDPDSRSGQLTVTSSPSGANVWIDGSGVGTTPFGPFALPQGLHEVEVANDDLVSTPRQVEIGESPEALEFVLEEKPEVLLVLSRTPGLLAEVPGGAPRPTPFLAAVPAGQQPVLATGLGLASTTVMTPVIRGPFVNVVEVNAPLALGWIDVSAAPDGEVMIDGASVGTGVVRVRAIAGPHLVSLSIPGSDPLEYEVDLIAGETVTVGPGGTEFVATTTPLALARTPEPERMPETDSVLDLPQRPEMDAGPSPAPPDAEPAAPALTRVAFGSCLSDDPSELAAEADRLTMTGEYAEARVCLLKLAASRPDDEALLLAELGELDGADLRIASLDPPQLRLVRSLRDKMIGLIGSSDYATLADDARYALLTAPNDPSFLLILRRGMEREVPLGETGLSLHAVYVPGEDERSANNFSLLQVRRPPAHGYLLSDSEITNEQFTAFLTAIDDRSASQFVSRSPNHIRQTREGGYRPVPGRERLPVTDATWEGMEAFATWVGGRLPDYSEWLWAYYLGGKGLPPSFENANLLEPGRPREVVPVASNSADGLGLFDMAGNVWETLGGGAQDGSEGRSLSGGSYTSDATSVARTPTITVPKRQTRQMRQDIGFRVLIPAVPAKH